MSKYNRRRHYRERRAARTRYEIETQLRTNPGFLQSKSGKRRLANILEERQARIEKALLIEQAVHREQAIPLSGDQLKASHEPAKVKKGPSRSERQRQERRASRKAKTPKPEQPS